jgi:hypothetical protein
VRATNVFYYLTYEGAVDLESTQETTTIFHRAKDDSFAKVKPKTTFVRSHLTDDEIGKPYSIYSEDLPDQNRSTYCTFSGRIRVFSEQL